MNQINFWGEEKSEIESKCKKTKIENKKVEFKIVSVKSFPNLKLTLIQIKLLIEALVIYKEYIKNSSANESRKRNELEKTEILFNFLQDISKFNYKEACNKCINKYAPKKGNTGLDTFGWIK